MRLRLRRPCADNVVHAPSSAHDPRPFSRFRPRLRTVVAVAILGVLGWKLGTEAFLDGLRAVDPFAVVAALAIGLVTTVASACRWRLVARRLGLPLSFGTAVADCYQALILNTVLPAGVLGDVNRAVTHGRESGDVGAGVRAVVLERVAGQVVLFVVGATVLVTQPAVLAPLGGGLVPALVIACPLLLAGGLWVRRARRAARVRRALAEFRTGARRGLLARDAWPGVVLLSLIALAGYVALFLVSARAVGSTAPTLQLLPLVVLALFVMGLPLNIGGWGPREAVAALTFGAVGLGAAQGVGAAVVYGVLTLIGTLPGAAVLIGRRARSRAGVAQGRVAEGEAGVGEGEAGVAEGRAEIAKGDAVSASRRVGVDDDVAPTKARGFDSRGLVEGSTEAANSRQPDMAITLPAMRAPLSVEAATSVARPGGSRSRGRAAMGRTEQV
jgi:uncharacterized membrane protein YbhN (UPF0104 family)